MHLGPCGLPRQLPGIALALGFLARFAVLAETQVVAFRTLSPRCSFLAGLYFSLVEEWRSAPSGGA